jgi:hypothetical protein
MREDRLNLNGYIMVWNCFTDLDDKYRLTPEELYLWCHLYTMRMYNDKVFSNIDIINESLPIKYYKKLNQNRIEIKNCLLSLREKSAITFSEHVENPLLRITLQCWNQKDVRYIKDNHHIGYEPVFYSEYFGFKDYIEFYIWVSVKRFSKLGGRDCSDEEWSILLDKSDSTVRRKVKNAIEQKLIYKQSGKWENERKQGKNKYNIKPFTEKESVADIPVVINEVTDELLFFEDVNEKTNIEWGNWKDRSKYLTENDCYLYWKQFNDPVFRKEADARRAVLTFNLDNWDSKAKLKINQESIKKIEDTLVNGVIYAGSSKPIPLDKKNIGDVDFDKVEFVYFRDKTGMLVKGDITKLSDSYYFDEMRHKKSVEIFRKLVVKDIPLDMDQIDIIRESV